METLQLKVIKIITETKTAVTILLENINGSPVEYLAGQFLTLILQNNGKELRRSYSISSTPGVHKTLSITVKRVVNGAVSRFLNDQLKEGEMIHALEPAGRFTITTYPLLKREIFFVAAGSGIVPVYSLVKKILREEPQSSVLLIYQNHDENDIIFEKQLQQLKKSHSSQFNWINLLSTPFGRNHSPLRLNNEMLEKIIMRHHQGETAALFYLCGPVSFMRMAAFTLKLMGFEDDQIKKENFVVEPIPPPAIITDSSSKEIIIHFNGQTFNIQAAYPLNILQAALNNNIQLPYSCRGGVCSTCIARCTKGKVVMSHNEVLTNEDMENGLVLTCVGYATTDVELYF